MGIVYILVYGVLRRLAVVVGNASMAIAKV